MKGLKRCLEFIKEPLLAVLSALLISQFLMMHTRIPSGSMIPTIQIGDHLIVNLMAPYYRVPMRGEIVVFKQDGQKLIKRVIGEPGDQIDLREGKVFINGAELDEVNYIHTYDSTREYSGHHVEFPYQVPEDYYFVMGDNRENSGDSRLFGAIPQKAILAIGAYRIFPLKDIEKVK